MAGLPLFPGALGQPLLPGLGQTLLPSAGLLLPPPPGAAGTAPGGFATGLLSTGSNPLLPGGLMSLLPGALRVNPATGMPLAPGDALRPGDWKCPNCGDHVFASRSECRKCKTLKPPELAAAQKKPEDVEEKPPPVVTPPPPEPKKPAQKWPIFIGNISYETTVDEVREVFTDAKGMLTVQLASDTTGSRGFGFAEFDSKENAEEAMRTLDGKEIRGRGIRLRWGNSVPLNNNPEEPADKPKTPVVPQAIEKVPVPFRDLVEGATDEEKQKKAYQAVLGTGAAHMRFMMKKTGCRLQLRGKGMPGTTGSADAGAREPLHIVIRPGAKSEDGTIDKEHVQTVKQLIDEILRYGKPLELGELSKELCTKGLACSSADCLFTHPKLPGIDPPADASATCRFFLIRAITVEKMQTSLNQGVWATCRANTVAFQDAFGNYDYVIFLFCAEDSAHFQGCARMASEPDPNLLPGFGGQKTIGDTFRITWLKQCMLPLKKVTCLRNSMNGLPFEKTEDGMEVPEHTGETCMRLMALQNSEDFHTLPTDVEAPFDILFNCRAPPSETKEKSRSRSRSKRARSKSGSRRKHARSKSQKRSRSRRRRSSSRTRTPNRGDTQSETVKKSTPTEDNGLTRIIPDVINKESEQQEKIDESPKADKASEEAVPAGAGEASEAKPSEPEPLAARSSSDPPVASSTDLALKTVTAASADAGPAWSKKPTGNWSVPAQPQWGYGGGAAQWGMPPGWQYGAAAAAYGAPGMPPPGSFAAPGVFPGMMPGMPPPGMPPGMPLPGAMPGYMPGGTMPQAGPPASWRGPAPPLGGWRPP